MCVNLYSVYTAVIYRLLSVVAGDCQVDLQCALMMCSELYGYGGQHLMIDFFDDPY